MAHGQLVDAAYISAVVSALKAANLTAFADTAQAVAFYASTEGATQVGMTLFRRHRPHSDLHHFRQAFASLPKSVLEDTPLLLKIISSQAMIIDLVDNTETGNQSFAFRYQEKNETVYADAVPVSGSIPSFMIYQINTVLSLPRTLAEAATFFFPSLAELMKQTGLFEPLAATKGITVFAPNDAAISAAGALIGTLDSTQAQNVLFNHVINGTVVYSDVSDEADYASAAGERFKFTTNATGSFVTSGNSTAQIITADIPIANGVVHIIDRVLANVNANTAAAQSAASSDAAQATTTSLSTAAKGDAIRSLRVSVGVAASVVAVFAGIFAGGALM
ncbi:hypothetical protein QFC22_003899 [Naganishia vaughanmartiniae]|uniref:Uncharacterized protein n=1 Tax=Naganishia vaughanmartiniae TaxID=1424756 RepID=A0ACC2X5Q5_9TREE|nr:hypothetical protein QFC22_003899 [Naganishia vaughanmartiniae]